MVRKYGTGSLSRRKDGRWRLAVSTKSGRRFYAAPREWSQKDAEAELARIVAVEAPELTGLSPLGKFLPWWLTQVRGSLRVTTIARYDGIIRVHLIPGLGRYLLAELSPSVISTFLRSLGGHDGPTRRVHADDRRHVDSAVDGVPHRPHPQTGGALSPQSVKHVRDVLRNALNLAVRWQLIERNPAALVEPPRIERKEMAVLSPEQIRRLWEVTGGQAGHPVADQLRGDGHRGSAAARSLAVGSGDAVDGERPRGAEDRRPVDLRAVRTPDRLHALYVLAASTGMRQAELLGLRWSDVDLDEGRLSVNVTLSRKAGMTVLAEPKTQSSRRTIGLPGVAVSALRTHRARQRQERLATGARDDAGGLVFVSQKYRPLHGSQVLQAFHRALERAGLPKVRFHSLRHSAATMMLGAGMTLEDVKQRLGHKNIQLTSDTYGHRVVEREREVAERIERLLGDVG